MRGGVAPQYNSNFDQPQWTDDNSDSEWSDSTADEAEGNHLLTNWDLKHVVIGGSNFAPLPAAHEPESPKLTSCVETLTTISWLFAPVLLFIVGLFFISTSVSIVKVKCSWSLWLYYLLIGIAFLWMTLTACMYVCVYKLRNNSKPLLDIHSSEVNYLIEQANPQNGTIEYSQLMEIVGQMAIINRNKAVTNQKVNWHFRPFDHYRGDRVPVSEIKKTIAKLSALSKTHKVMHAFSIVNLILLVGSLVYGSIYALAKHAHFCDTGLVHNLENSLLALWVVTLLMISSLAIYLHAVYGVPKGSVVENAETADANFMCLSHKP